jgi:hypothetical protein
MYGDVGWRFFRCLIGEVSIVPPLHHSPYVSRYANQWTIYSTTMTKGTTTTQDGWIPIISTTHRSTSSTWSSRSKIWRRRWRALKTISKQLYHTHGLLASYQTLSTLIFGASARTIWRRINRLRLHLPRVEGKDPPSALVEMEAMTELDHHSTLRASTTRQSS